MSGFSRDQSNVSEAHCCCHVYWWCFCLSSSSSAHSFCPSVVSDSCNPMVSSCQVPLVHGIFQARILEWVVIPFSRGSSRPRDPTHVSCIGRRTLYRWPSTDKRRSSTSHCSTATCFSIYLLMHVCVVSSLTFVLRPLGRGCFSCMVTMELNG